MSNTAAAAGGPLFGPRRRGRGALRTHHGPHQPGVRACPLFARRRQRRRRRRATSSSLRHLRLARGEAGLLVAVAAVGADAKAARVGKHILQQLALVLQGRERRGRGGVVNESASAFGWVGGWEQLASAAGRLTHSTAAGPCPAGRRDGRGGVESESAGMCVCVWAAGEWASRQTLSPAAGPYPAGYSPRATRLQTPPRPPPPPQLWHQIHLHEAK